MELDTHEAFSQGPVTKPRRWIPWLVGLFILVLIGSGIGWLMIKQSPILVGVSITLTGPEASNGQSILNTVHMAVEEKNVAGGIRGRQVRLLVKDDRGKAELGIRNDLQLVEAGVVAIFGHMASRVTEPAIHAMARVDPHMLYINNYSSAHSLTGRDDNFIRLMPDGAVMSENYAKFFLPRSKDKRVAVIYEKTFPAVSDSILPAFVDNWQKLGGTVTAQVGLDSESSFDARQIARWALRAQPSSVFIVLPPLPAAILCQHLRAQQARLELLISTWALAGENDFLAFGGQAVEGAAGLVIIPVIPKTPRHISYTQNYEKRYKRPSTRVDVMAYEAMQVLLWALQQTDDHTKFKELILQQKTFDVVTGPVTLDAFGDNQRPFYITRVLNGRLVNEGMVTPSALDTAAKSNEPQQSH